MVLNKKAVQTINTRFVAIHKQIVLNIISSSETNNLQREVSSYRNRTNPSCFKRSSNDFMKAKTRVLTPYETSYRISGVRFFASYCLTNKYFYFYLLYRSEIGIKKIRELNCLIFYLHYPTSSTICAKYYMIINNNLFENLILIILFLESY